MSNYGTPERDHALPTRRTSTTEGPSSDASAPSHPLLTLQRQVGNAQIARMLAQRAAPEEEELLQARHDTAQRAAPEEEELLQARHDTAQREAAPEEEELLQARHDTAQREGAPEEEEELLQARHDTAQRAAPEEEDELLQASHDTAQRESVPEVGVEGGPVSNGLASRIDSQRGSGSPLDHSTRSTMEGAFGTNFEQVRVHTDSESDALNRSISAKAFTTGTDIFMRQDSSPTDHNLLAHELTHVVQQQSMAGSGSGMTVGAAGDSYEQQADAVASAVTSGQATPQRKADEQS